MKKIIHLSLLVLFLGSCISTKQSGKLKFQKNSNFEKTELSQIEKRKSPTIENITSDGNKTNEKIVEKELNEILTSTSTDIVEFDNTSILNKKEIISKRIPEVQSETNTFSDNKGQLYRKVYDNKGVKALLIFLAVAGGIIAGGIGVVIISFSTSSVVLLFLGLFFSVYIPLWLFILAVRYQSNRIYTYKAHLLALMIALPIVLGLLLIIKPLINLI